MTSFSLGATLGALVMRGGLGEATETPSLGSVRRSLLTKIEIGDGGWGYVVAGWIALLLGYPLVGAAYFLLSEASAVVARSILIAGLACPWVGALASLAFLKFGRRSAPSIWDDMLVLGTSIAISLPLVL